MNRPDDVIVAPAESAPRVVHLHSRRVQRVRAVQRMQHLIPAVTLLTAGVLGLQGGAEGVELVLALLEIATSAVLAVSILRSLRSLRAKHHQAEHGHAGGIDWVDVFAAAVIYTEAFERWVTHHHVARPLVLLGTVTLGLGLFHGRILQRMLSRRALRLTDEGLAIGGGKFRPVFRARWEEIEAIEIGARDATIRCLSGKSRRIDLRDLENAPEVVTALHEAQLRLPAALPA